MPSLEDAIGAVRQAKNCFMVTPKSQVQSFVVLLTKKPETGAVPFGNWAPHPPQPSFTS